MSKSLVSMLVFGWFLSLGMAWGETKTVFVKIQVDSQSPGYEGHRAMDGDPRTMWHTDFHFNQTRHPHEIIVDLGASYDVAGLAYLPREAGGNGTIAKYECYLSADKKKFGKPAASGSFTNRTGENIVKLPAAVKARYVKLRALSEVTGQLWTSIAELRILVDGVTFRAKASSTRVFAQPNGKPADELTVQFEALRRDLRNRGHFARVASSVLHAQAAIAESDRDPVDVVLRRTAALLADIKAMPSAPNLKALEAELVTLKQAGAQGDIKDTDARLALFKKVCGVRRKISLANPLLDFNKILLLKRHRSRFNHMCDQYYGINTVPGGGLYVLSDPFGPKPKLRDILVDSKVQGGRLAGKTLEGGSFLSPDLSFDGKRITFAYVECQGDTRHRHHTDPSKGHWHEGRIPSTAMAHQEVLSPPRRRRPR